MQPLVGNNLIFCKIARNTTVTFIARTLKQVNESSDLEDFYISTFFVNAIINVC